MFKDFYEAACRMSEEPDDFSCCVLHSVNHRCAEVYEKLMGGNACCGDLPCTVLVDKAASYAGWPRHHFRTFMLLMAAEAVK